MSSLKGNWGRFLVTAFLGALVLISITFWALRLFTARPTPVSAAPVENVVLIDTATVSRVLGERVSPVVTQTSLASRLVLRGVLAGVSGGGAALISVDGKPAQPIRVGGIIAENLVLQSVVGRTAVLGTEKNGAPVVSLEMPALKMQ